VDDDAAIGEQTRSYLKWWAEGSKDDRLELFDEVAQADRTGFPRGPAVEALSRLDARVLWKTFPLPELAELREWAEEAGLDGAAKRLRAAEDDAPYTDPGRIPKMIRQGVMKRDMETCVECGAKDHLQVDHVLAWSEGGSSTDPENLQVLCGSCNASKGARPARMPRRRRPPTIAAP
jgi:hypothetical protein